MSRGGARLALLLAAALAAALAPALALAHKPSDSYLTLKLAGDRSGGDRTITGQWDIALRDLDLAIGLDANGDGDITWGEVRARHADIAAYALARLSLRSGGEDCVLQSDAQLIDRHTDGAYTVLPLRVSCPQPPVELSLSYRLFADIDPQHRGLLRLELPDGTRTAVLGPQADTQVFELQRPSRLRQFIGYAREGVWHIWIGFDHILFLLSLLLPAVLVVQGSRHWRAADGLRPVCIDVLKVITAFTAAHSITLSLATLGVVELPSRWVEATIAASVGLAALNNLWPLVQRRRWAVAFGFGLIHGFGFASVLADLGLPRDALLLALLGFNLGVEVGQLAIVALFLPPAYLLRHTTFYRAWVFTGGSLAIAALALLWLAERLFNLEVLPF